MKRSFATSAMVLLVGSGLLMCSSSRRDMVQFEPKIAVAPRDARVFTGNSLQFQTHLAGELTPAQVRWSVVGPGSIDANGLYRAANAAASADVVASAGGGLVDSVAVHIVPAPKPGQPLMLSTCYADGTVNVNAANDRSFIGALSVGGRAAGITVDPANDRAVFVVESQVVAIDLRTMRWRVSAPLSGVRLSEVALLAHGFVAATDNNASAGQTGIRVFRIGTDRLPRLVSSVVAGETPEGIAASADGRTFYVTNINGHSVMRFAIDPSGHVTLLRVGRTATRPFGVALDAAHHEIFVADNDTSVVSGARAKPGLERFDSTTLRLIGTMISTGSATSLPLGVAVDPKSARVFVTNEGDQNVVVFSLPAMRRIASIPTGLTPWLPTLDATTERLYVPNARDNTVSIYDTRLLRAIAPAVPTCSYPTSVAIAPARSRGR